jgi:hypothetical protein
VQEIEIYSASTAIAFQAERCPGLPAGHAGNIVCLGEQKGCYSARTGGPNQKFRDDKRDPQFQHAADILRNADIGFGNFEGNTIDIRYFKGYPAGSLDDADITLPARLIWQRVSKAWVSKSCLTRTTTAPTGD